MEGEGGMKLTEGSSQEWRHACWDRRELHWDWGMSPAHGEAEVRHGEDTGKNQPPEIRGEVGVRSEHCPLGGWEGRRRAWSLGLCLLIYSFIHSFIMLTECLSCLSLGRALRGTGGGGQAGLAPNTVPFFMTVAHETPSVFK